MSSASDVSSREGEPQELLEARRRILELERQLAERHDGPVRRTFADKRAKVNEESLRAILSTAFNGIVTIDQAGVIVGANPAAERMFGYAPDELLGRNVKVLMPPPYCDEHDEYLERFQRTREPRIIGSVRELLGKRQDGSTFPLELAVSQVDHLGLFTGILQDISERRQLQQQVLEVAVAEQRRIGHELHDGIQQELTGLSLLASTLLEVLKSGHEEPSADGDWRFRARNYSQLCDLAMKLCERLAVANQHVHQLAHGILSVEIDPEGLRAELQELAASLHGLNGLTCRFVCTEPVAMVNPNTAKHLYRIAQESLNNAVRHAQATEIEMSLRPQNGELTLEVRDNGVGIGSVAALHRPRIATMQGLGLRAMNYRAGIIGGRLTVERLAGGGTSVKCVVSFEARDQ